MNTLKTIVLACVTALTVAASMTPARAVENVESVLPQISALTAKVGKYIAAELKAQMVEALSMPRAQTVRRTPTVLVTEDSLMVVVASRLPPEQSATVASVNTSVNVRL
jgi:hypothetical protein